MPLAARDAQPALVLLNPAAAGGRALRWAPALQQWLRQQAPGVTCHIPASAQELVACIQQAPEGSRVVLVGGDGTVHCALPALVERRHEMGLVPLGSGNDTARALGLQGMPWASALRLALSGPASPWDLGHCESLAPASHAGPSSKLFVSSLAAGFDASVGLRALRGPRWLRGMPRYLWATLSELAQVNCLPMRVWREGHLWHEGPCLFVSVLNTPSYGGGMPAVPHASCEDGQLDAVIAGHLSTWATAALLPRLLAARHLSHPRVNTQPFRRLVVQSEHPVALAGDGESLGASTHWQVSCLPAALRVVRATMRTS